MAKFLSEIVQTLKTFNQGPIFVKFSTIQLEKDEETGFLYPEISSIQFGYISKQFELNIEAIKKFEPFSSMNLGLTTEELGEPLLINCILLDSKVYIEDLTILF